jgi:hypothetical protein
MNHSGDAAEQIVRMSLEGVEVAAKITGNAAKEIALLLMAAMKSPDKGTGGGMKLKGKERMATMLKSGKALEIYSVKESDLKKFYQGAKQYGIVYCVLRNSKSTPDGLCDILVKAEDAPKISRVAERFKFATVDKAKIESEIVAAKAEKSASEKTTETGDAPTPDSAEQPDAPDVNDTDKLMDDLLGTPEGKPAPEKTEVERTDEGKTTPGKEPTAGPPLAAEPSKSPPSKTTSESRSKSARATSKPSVKGEIREITAAQKAREKAKETDAPARDDKAAADKSKANPAITHKQPQGGRKTKKSKERT